MAGKGTDDLFVSACLQLRAVFESALASRTIGLSYALVDEPELVTAMFQRIGRLIVAADRQLATMETAGALRQAMIWTSDEHVSQPGGAAVNGSGLLRANRTGLTQNRPAD